MNPHSPSSFHAHRPGTRQPPSPPNNQANIPAGSDEQPSLGMRLGLVGSLVGTGSGVTCALTTVLSRSDIDGLWFGLLGATIGISCAVAGAVIYYVQQNAARQA